MFNLPSYYIFNFEINLLNNSIKGLSFIINKTPKYNVTFIIIDKILITNKLLAKWFIKLVTGIKINDKNKYLFLSKEKILKSKFNFFLIYKHSNIITIIFDIIVVII